MSNAGTRRFALIGKSGAGKSTVAGSLCQGADIRRVSTGQICRQIAKLLFDNDDKASTQRVDDALTLIDPSVFLQAALRGVDLRESICLDALRFQSDYAIARDLGFKIIRVSAPDALRVRRLAERGQVFDLATDGQHRSEVELDAAAVDFTIRNEGTREDVDAAVRAILGAA
ncbi:hypothetical protein E0H68_03375 [Rhizobium leguminosarum bv. viciae]|uniref:AAA family ATPase n=1 Tax=Rhizobium leguminosarum TaxID=384 RepID=UPI00103FAC4E|nr:AAA family ATPase [Rhizobium leguminosarum]TCA18490.1 hypothetical protein E0H68_03375 [Rhizobium leguminosarum bv. viciae]